MHKVMPTTLDSVTITVTQLLLITTVIFAGNCVFWSIRAKSD